MTHHVIIRIERRDEPFACAFDYADSKTGDITRCHANSCPDGLTGDGTRMIRTGVSAGATIEQQNACYHG